MKICLFLAILATVSSSELEGIVSQLSELEELSADLSHQLDDRQFRQEQPPLPTALAEPTVLLERTTSGFTAGYNGHRQHKRIYQDLIFNDVELDHKWHDGAYGHKTGAEAIFDFFEELYRKTGDICLPKPGEKTWHILVDDKIFSGPNNLYAQCKIYLRFCNGRLLTILLKGTLTETTDPKKQIYGIKYLHVYPGTMDRPTRGQGKMYFDYLYIEEFMYNRVFEVPFKDIDRVDGVSKTFYSDDRWLHMQSMNDSKTILYPCVCTDEMSLYGPNATSEKILELYQKTEKETGGWNWNFNNNRGRTIPSFDILKEGHIYTQFNMTTVHGRVWKIRFVIKEDYPPFPLGKRFSWQVHEFRLDEVTPLLE